MAIDPADDRELRLSDGTRITYRVVGDEGPPLLLCNGVTTTHFFWDGALAGWGHRRVIQWDYPGHGTSGPAHSPASARLPALAEAACRVLDAVEVDSAPLVGFSMGSEVALLAALQAPDRFSATVSLLGPAGRLFDTALWGVGGRTTRTLLRALPQASLGVFHKALHLGMSSPLTYAGGRLLGLYGSETRPHQVRALADHLGTLHAPTVREMVLSAGELDLYPRLHTLQSPLLIVTGERDAFAPARTVGRAMHAAAPGSQLAVLRDGTHGSLFGHASTIVETIERFFSQHDV